MVVYYVALTTRRSGDGTDGSLQFVFGHSIVQKRNVVFEITEFNVHTHDK